MLKCKHEKKIKETKRYYRTNSDANRPNFSYYFAFISHIVLY